MLFYTTVHLERLRYIAVYLIRKIMNLDMRLLPTSCSWNADTRAATPLEKVVIDLKPTIERMMADDIIAKRDSFGFALASPGLGSALYSAWDNPTALIGLVVWWGPEGPRYAANACRKLRPAARESMDTEVIRRSDPYLFSDIIPSIDEGGNFPWGDFPFDGATYVNVQGRDLLGAVSAFPKEQDPMIARLVTSRIGLAIHYSDRQLQKLRIMA